MSKTKTIGMNEVSVERLPVPKNLTQIQYADLRNRYVDVIVKSKKALKESFEKYKGYLAEVLSFRRKLNDAEERLVETAEMILKVSKKKK